MYISNVRNVIFFFSRFFLKKRRETNIFSGKTLKNRNIKPFPPLPPSSLPPHPGAKQKVDHLVKNVSCQSRALALSWCRRVDSSPRDGSRHWSRLREEPGAGRWPFFSSEGRMQSRHFVFRTLCNILEWDIGVFRDLVSKQRLIKSVQFILFQIFLSLY